MSDSVGYCNPPKHSQFRKGHSGNPNGRPKNKSFDEVLMDELNMSIPIKENGQHVEITKQQALIKMFINKCMSGDLEALKLLVRRFPAPLPVVEENPAVFMLKMGSPKVQDNMRRAQLLEELNEIESRIEDNKLT